MVKAVKKAIVRTAALLGYHVGVLPPTAGTAQDHVALLCEKFGLNCVIDVGAHRGEYGGLLRQAGYTGRIVSFEPVGENFLQLQETSAKDDAWYTHHMALGDADERLEINVNVGTETSSFLKPSSYGQEKFRGKLGTNKTEKVEVRLLDSVIKECISGIKQPRVFLKIDAQGYDMKVIQGAEKSLPMIAGLQMELAVQRIYEGMLDYRECIEQLNRMGYLLSAVFPVRIDDSMRLIEMDCIMVHNNFGTNH
jgi:FkbM family methyltransferase